MKNSVLRSGAAALAAAALLLTAGCAADEDTPESEESATEESGAQTDTEETDGEEPAEAGPAQIPDVTVLVLETGLANLTALGLEVEVVDEDGAALEVEDATAYQITAQDPAEGTAEPGDVVTLTVRER